MMIMGMMILILLMMKRMVGDTVVYCKNMEMMMRSNDDDDEGDYDKHHTDHGHVADDDDWVSKMDTVMITTMPLKMNGKHPHTTPQDDQTRNVVGDLLLELECSGSRHICVISSRGLLVG